MSVLRAFPRRPLKVLRAPSDRIGLGNLIALLSLVGVLVADAVFMLPSIYDDATIGTSGTPALEARLGEGGKCWSKILSMCDIEVLYRTVDRTQHHVSLHYLTTFQTIDDHTQLTAHYDLASADHISTSWGRDLLVNRIVTNAVLVAVGVSLLVSFLLSYRTSIRLRKSLVAMARDPRPVIAKFLAAVPAKTFATIRFAWTDPAGGDVREDRSRLSGTTQPFWLDRERTTMLALAGPDGHAHLLDEDLTIVDLSDEERVNIRAAVGSGAAAA